MKGEVHDVQEGTSSSSNASEPREDDMHTPQRDLNPIKTAPLSHERFDIWNRIRQGHVATAMKFRSLLLFISSTIVNFIETISEPKPDKVPPTEIITRIVTSFINGSVEQQHRLSHETFLDILLEKIPNSDVRGMHYHEVYLAISPMISSVNWARIKFDRRDAMRCYKSLAEILQICFEQIGLANHAEADQLILAIYVTSVWCSILKQHPELSNPISDHQDFEAYMKGWVFQLNFENFAKVFVASCCQIMESSDHIKQKSKSVKSKTLSVPEKPETPRPLSLSSSIPGTPNRLDMIPSPAMPSPSRVHPSWTTPAPPPHFDPYIGYMSPGPAHFSPFPPTVVTHAPIDPHQNYPHVLTSNRMEQHFCDAKPAQKTPRIAKRKQKLPTFQELATSISKKTNKKGPRPERGVDDSRDRGESPGDLSSG